MVNLSGEMKYNGMSDDAIYRREGYGKSPRTTNVGMTDTILRTLLDWAGVARRGRMLEIGCGDGNGTLFLHRCGYDVVGVDISPHAVKMARKRLDDCGIDTARIIEAEAADLNMCENETFDIVLDSCSFQCVLDLDQRRRFLMEACRVCKNGGSFIGKTMCQPFTEITYAYKNNVSIEGEIVCRRLDSGDRLVPFRIVRTRAEIDREMNDAGFTLLSGIHREEIRGFGAWQYTWHCRKESSADNDEGEGK
jgi:ubiquinone/menaquinone biosynthesis C-methylase UbiE